MLDLCLYSGYTKTIKEVPDLESAGAVTFTAGIYMFNMMGAFPKLTKVANRISFSSASFLDTGTSQVFGALEEVQSISIGSVGTISCKPADACHVDMAEWFPVLKTVTSTLSITSSPAITGFGFKSLERVTLTIYANMIRLAFCKSRVDHLLNAIAQSTSSRIEVGLNIQGC